MEKKPPRELKKTIQTLEDSQTAGVDTQANFLYNSTDYPASQTDYRNIKTVYTTKQTVYIIQKDSPDIRTRHLDTYIDSIKSYTDCLNNQS